MMILKLGIQVRMGDIMEIDQRMLGHFKERMNMNYDEDDDSRIDVVQNAICVIEHFQEAILERNNVTSYGMLGFDARQAFGYFDEVLEYLKEVVEKLEE